MSAPSEESAEGLFPAFLKLAGRKVVVVGGGRVAASKLESLLLAQAAVTVVAPQVRDEIAQRGVEVLQRNFAPQDLEGAWFVIAAGPPELNREVVLEAERRRIFANAVDEPQNCSAYTAGVFRRGGVTVAVSTGGSAPALAGLLREGLEAVVPNEVGAWVQEARSLRKVWRAEKIPMFQRRPQLLEALNRLYEAKGHAQSETL